MMTAEELKLNDEQYDSLIQVRDLMKAGSLVHVDVEEDDSSFVYEEKFSGKFNMNYWIIGTKCGTCGCIGGSSELLSGNKELWDDNVEGELHDLFYPFLSDNIMNYSSITVEEALQALDNYLNTGKSNWKDILE